MFLHPHLPPNTTGNIQLGTVLPKNIAKNVRKIKNKKIRRKIPH